MSGTRVTNSIEVSTRIIHSTFGMVFVFLWPCPGPRLLSFQERKSFFCIVQGRASSSLHSTIVILANTKVSMYRIVWHNSNLKVSTWLVLSNLLTQQQSFLENRKLGVFSNLDYLKVKSPIKTDKNLKCMEVTLVETLNEIKS